MVRQNNSIHYSKWNQLPISVEIPNAEEVKSYWLSTHFKATWDIAMTICSSYGMEFLSLDSQVEADNFFKLCSSQRQLFEKLTHIGALATTTRSITDWYWVNSGNKIEINLVFPWIAPTNWFGRQMCLALDKQLTGFMYNDINCYGLYPQKFICQSKEVDFTTLARSL